MNPELLQMHRQTVETFRTDIADIAAKWTAGLASMSYEKLTSEPLLDRVRNSANYFRKKIEEVFDHLLEVSKKLQSNNKEATRRYDDTLSTLTPLLSAFIPYYIELLSILLQNYNPVATKTDIGRRKDEEGRLNCR